VRLRFEPLDAQLKEEYRTSHFGSDGTASSYLYVRNIRITKAFSERWIARRIAHFEIFRELFTEPTSQEQRRSDDRNRLSSVKPCSPGVNQFFSLDVKN
jgi:hypothetical protein